MVGSSRAKIPSTVRTQGDAGSLPATRPFAVSRHGEESASQTADRETLAAPAGRPGHRLGRVGVTSGSPQSLPGHSVATERSVASRTHGPVPAGGGGVLQRINGDNGDEEQKPGKRQRKSDHLSTPHTPTGAASHSGGPPLGDHPPVAAYGHPPPLRISAYG